MGLWDGIREVGGMRGEAGRDAGKRWDGMWGRGAGLVGGFANPL